MSEQSLTLTLFTKPGCSLCVEVREVLEELAGELPFVYEEFDIRSDEAILQRYRHRLPVLQVNQTIELEGRISFDDIVAAIAQALGTT